MYVETVSSGLFEQCTQHKKECLALTILHLSTVTLVVNLYLRKFFCQPLHLSMVGDGQELLEEQSRISSSNDAY